MTSNWLRVPFYPVSKEGVEFINEDYDDNKSNLKLANEKAEIINDLVEKGVLCNNLLLKFETVNEFTDNLVVCLTKLLEINENEPISKIKLEIFRGVIKMLEFKYLHATNDNRLRFRICDYNPAKNIDDFSIKLATNQIILFSKDWDGEIINAVKEIFSLKDGIYYTDTFGESIKDFYFFELLPQISVKIVNCTKLARDIGLLYGVNVYYLNDSNKYKLDIASKFDREYLSNFYENYFVFSKFNSLIYTSKMKHKAKSAVEYSEKKQIQIKNEIEWNNLLTEKLIKRELKNWLFMLLEDKKNSLFKYLLKCVTSQNKDAVVDDDINNPKYSEIIDMIDENWREIIIATSNNFNENCFNSRMFQNNNNDLRKILICLQDYQNCYLIIQKKFLR